MSPFEGKGLGPVTRVPRASGDEPIVNGAVNAVNGCSPRERG